MVSHQKAVKDRANLFKKITLPLCSLISPFLVIIFLWLRESKYIVLLNTLAQKCVWCPNSSPKNWNIFCSKWKWGTISWLIKNCSSPEMCEIVLIWSQQIVIYQLGCRRKIWVRYLILFLVLSISVLGLFIRNFGPTLIGPSDCVGLNWFLAYSVHGAGYPCDWKFEISPSRTTDCNYAKQRKK